jgi:hypothetical protein
MISIPSPPPFRDSPRSNIDQKSPYLVLKERSKGYY